MSACFEIFQKRLTDESIITKLAAGDLGVLLPTGFLKRYDFQLNRTNVR